jgi:hypothetical protein
MSQSPTQSILSTQHYRNPRHAQEAIDLEEYEKSLQNPQAQEGKDTDLEVKPDHNWEKRYKDLQSYTAKKISNLEVQIKDSMQQNVPKMEAPKSQEELDAFKAQNPEMYAVIQSMAQNMSEKHMTEYDSKLAVMQGTMQETSQERAVLKLKQAHSDYETVMNSDAFHDWAATQSTQVQDWIYKNPDNADLAIQALSLFKYHSGWGKNNNTDTKNTKGNTGGDESVNTRHTKVEPGATDRNHPAYQWKESDIADMRPEEFGKWSEHISLAQRENRILFGQ